MLKNTSLLISFVFALSFLGAVQAAENTWTDASGDHLWSTGQNWSSLAPPTSAENAKIKILPGPTIVNEGAVAKGVWLATSSSTGALTVDGGTLTAADTVVLGYNPESNGTLNVISGSVTMNYSINVGREGVGTLNIAGGTVTVAASLGIANRATATGHVNLDGGVLAANDIRMREVAGAVGTMNIKAGTLIIQGDKFSKIQGYIDSGWITAYDNQGTLQLDYDVTNEGKTTLTAVHSLNPNPGDGARSIFGEKELSWTLPDPCVPGTPVRVDVYFTDQLHLLKEFTDPAAIQVVSNQNVTSAVVQTQIKTWYYWAVDTYVGSDEDPIFGPIFSFYADNLPPHVDAGDDIETWLDNGLKVVQLDGVVQDEGGPEPVTFVWTMIAEPNELNPAQISDPLVENPTVTLKELGTYTLQLEAIDGEFTTTDTKQIVLYADACDHAKNQEGFELIPGDINEDCIVNEADLTILEEHWLQWNYSTE